MRHAVALTGAANDVLRGHLLRRDGQEDVCLATYRTSTGEHRRSALLRNVELPRLGERDVHGNASFTGDYVLRVASAAKADDCGVAVLHSHPGARCWQTMSGPDADAERSFAYLVHEITGLPLVGMTMAGTDGSWSARFWEPAGVPVECESVRVIGDTIRVSWNDSLRPPPTRQPSQVRTVSGWGTAVQADLARLRVLVIGAGSVGLEVALRLAASGIEHVAVMDYDTVEIVNLDRLIGATRLDALLHRAKIEVAHRLLLRSATALRPDMPGYDLSVCEPKGHITALDYDVIFSCVDRPWPRAVLNMLAYADLIPVIDGGLHIDAFPDGGMRNATWRSHVIRPGRPCLSCNNQLELGQVAADREGLLDDPDYIRGVKAEVPAHQNVATLATSVVSGLLSQFVSFVAAPGGLGEPGPLQYVLSTHSLTHLTVASHPRCYFERSTAAGDRRLTLTAQHAKADHERRRRGERQQWTMVRAARWIDGSMDSARQLLERVLAD